MSIHSKIFPIGLLASASIFAVFPAFSQADLSDADYQAALKIAQKKVARLKSLNSQSANALSSSLIRNLFGRMYRVGDQWDVAAISFDNPMARMTDDPAKLELKTGRTAVFRYQVVSVKNPPESEVIIRVTQLEEHGQKKADARVQHLQLLMNDRMLQSKKTYAMIDRSGQVHNIAVSPDAIHSRITPLELYPLDVPELLTAESMRAEPIPGLPDKLQAIASQTGFRLEPSKSFHFNQDDFYGRPIEAIWQSGDPWPAFLKTSNGISILIRKGAS